MRRVTIVRHGTRNTALVACLCAMLLAPTAFAGPDKPDFPPFDEFAKDYHKVLGPQGESGFLPIYHKDKGDELLAVIPRAMIGQNFLIANSIAGGEGLAGSMWGSMVVQWQEKDKQLVLIAPETRYEKGGGSAVSEVINRTYTDRIVLATPIVSKRGGDPVIDLDRVFKSDFANVGRVYGGRMDGSLSRWAELKAFPNNVELTVDAAIMQQQGGVRAKVHHSLVKLPQSDYKPRKADSRIGYFLTARMNWSKDHNADTVFDRYINRWDVRKAQPDKPVSDVDPDYQITFYIEKTVPVKYRRYVREGILAWNRAFEAAGIRNAVQVIQQTDTNEYKDIDPEDVRYSFIRWIVSGRAFARGPSLSNPFTGQILDADIVFDDALARSFQRSYETFSGTAMSDGYDEQLSSFFKQHPEWAFKPTMEYLLPGQVKYGGVDNSLDPRIKAEMEYHHATCTCAQGIAHDMAFNLAALQAAGKANLTDQYVGQMIRYVTTHEVGHTLGLRHNFKASSWKPVDAIMNHNDPNEPTVASVMDYVAAIVAPEGTDQKFFATPVVGPYDTWAIQYGYQNHTSDMDATNEDEMLKQIASRCAEDGLDYATDEDTMFFAPDPLVNRWDNGSDLLDYARQRMDMVRNLQSDMLDWAVKDGDSYNKLRNQFDMLLSEYSRSAGFASRYLGGQYAHRDHKGDPHARPPLEIVNAGKQRAAMDFLVNTIFSDKEFRFEPKLLNRLAAGRWNHWGSDAMDTQLDYPIHDRIAATQFMTLFRVLNPVTLNRIHDAELKVPADQDAVTAPDVLTAVNDAIWTELKETPGRRYTNREPYISSIRRSLQRQHLNMMLNMVLSKPGETVHADIQSVAVMKLRELASRMGEVLANGGQEKLDGFTRAHLDACKSRIDRALKAEFRL